MPVFSVNPLWDRANNGILLGILVFFGYNRPNTPLESVVLGRIVTIF